MKKIKDNVIRKIDKTSQMMQVGSVIFGVGLLIAVISAFLTTFLDLSATVNQFITALLIILGIIIGYVNISSSETTEFLAASLVLILLVGPFLGNLVQTFELAGDGARLLSELFKNLIGLVVPAAIVVALRALFKTAKDR